MNRILIPTDFSENASIAAKYAFELFQNSAQSFVVLNTYQTPHAGASMLVSIEEILKQESIGGLRETQTQLEGFLGEGVKIEFESEEGDLASCVQRKERNSAISMIVMGTKGADKIQSKLLGSNTWQVTQKVKSPVIIVPEDAEVRAPRRVMLSTDLSGIDPKSLEPLLVLIDQHKAQLVVVHIDTAEETSSGQKYFRGALDNSAHEFHTIKGKNVIDDLNQFAIDQNIDMVAMVKHKRGFFEKLFTSSTTKGMALGSTFPMLILREES